MVGQSDDGPILSHPMPLRRLPSPELTAPVEDLRQIEGLAVGGLREVPVRW
ncbi:hypothetical protein [Streptosporangium sp. NBC_01756]|uniref:hypothetical protein n=1 Tax=Streptosporangium sp. NBC_01756 TaxID=2975950 RepID=UPI002DDAD2BC|nr:hypothetical protein [Streptosporangium sp. NBC_01756]WSC86196.1 hypothetical protein OIE48_38545 [Streptosporangium sp. NBC_01756]